MSSSASKVVLAAGALVALAACSGGTPSSETVSTAPSEAIVLPDATTASPTSPASDLIADIEVDDQVGDGTEVIVTSVQLGRGPAWLVVTDLPGNVLGTKKVSPRTQPVTVPLKPPVTQSQELIATLYLDDGNGNFDNKDAVMVDDEGEPVSEDFDYVVQ